MMEALLDEHFPERLRRRLERPLPGRAVQRTMTSELAYGRHFGPCAWDARPAAVVVLIYRRGRRWCVPLTLRPDHMIDHAGQVSFPGGVIEQGETPEQCASREYEEELGAARAGLTMLGRLSPLYVFGSNFRVTPCVAVATGHPAFKPNPAEVARVLEFELGGILGPGTRGTHRVRRPGVCFTTHHLCCGEDLVWGATGMILAEFLHVVAEARTATPSGL